MCGDRVRGVGEGAWPGGDRRGQHPFTQARFPSLSNAITAEGEPPFTHGLLGFLPGQPLPLSPSSTGDLVKSGRSMPHLISECVPCSTCSPSPFSSLERAPEVEIVSQPPLPATLFYNLQTQLSLSESPAGARNRGKRARCLPSRAPHRATYP